jgi:UDP-2-acetamido-3-amino-2,3-dideoxy-glucuronate N-acetyltransferase
VTKDVPDYALVYGSPAKQHGWICECGVKLDEGLTCPECGVSYRIVDSVLKKEYN